MSPEEASPSPLPTTEELSPTPTQTNPQSVEEIIDSLDTLHLLTDEQLLEKYAPCFNFESEYINSIKAGKRKAVEEDDDEGELSEGKATGEVSVEEATRRIKADRASKKTTKKKIDAEELKKMLLEDAELLKES